MRSPLFGLATAAAFLLAGRSALANGRFPSSNQIIFSPTNENIIVGRASYAILPSNDNGKTWGYLCEEALALPTVGNFEDPELGLTANNSLIAGLYQPARGLDVSHDLGCNWDCVGGPLANQQIADIVVRPDMPPHRVLALTGTSADAGVVAQVFESTDDGATWAALGTSFDLPDANASVATIEVSASDPMRIYVSANRGYVTARTASLFVSMDNGTSWVEHPVPEFNPPIPCADAPSMPSMMCQSEDQLFIAAVDPTDANRVYLRSNGLPASTATPGYSRLYLTTDGGQTFSMVKAFAIPTTQDSAYTQSGEMLGFALSPDNSKVFIGTKETGLWSASKADLTFRNVNSKVGVQCLAARQTGAGPELWACASEPFGGFIFGKSTDEGVTFQPMMTTLTSLSGLIACSASGATSNACSTHANASACSCSGYQMFCSQTETVNACFGCGQDGPPSPPRSASCGCSVVGSGGAAGFLAACAIGAVALGRRRRQLSRNVRV